MRFRLQLCCLVGLLAAHAAPAQTPVDVDDDAAIVAQAAPTISVLSDDGRKGGERIVLGFAFALLAGVVVYRLRVDEG